MRVWSSMPGLCTLALCGLLSRGASAAPPSEAAQPEAAQPEPEQSTLRGRVLEAGGSRAPVSGAVVLLVDAPIGVRPGRAAKDPLDPETVTWMLRAETDLEGRFRFEAVPEGTLRVVVVAGGYARFEQWALAPDARELDLYVQPELDSAYRTEVGSERIRLAEPDHTLDAQQARHHAGSGDDPVLAALNLPGVARSPGGLGLLSLRGGNPTQTGIYLDGHPIPRAFHVVPIASVISAAMTDRVELSPGAYGPEYGGFSSGMVHLRSRKGGQEGVHGQAHVDLFDLGISNEAPVGPGSVHFGFRRSHVDGVLRTVERFTGPTGILYPTYWDYLGRFDLPLGRGHRITLRALGAGDRLRGPGPGPDGFETTLFDFASSFHRFDLDYHLDDGDWQVLISPSLRLDATRLEQSSLVRRDASVFSGRVEAQTQLREGLGLHVGGDVVYERWRRRQRVPMVPGGDIISDEDLVVDDVFRGEQLRAGMWVATRLHGPKWSLTPSLRLNTFHYAGLTHVRLDPRIEARGHAHPKLELFAKLGMFSVPVVVTNGSASANLINQNGVFLGGVADVPPYLVTYFDPGVEGEVREGSSAATQAVQASTGLEIELPWELRGRATAFWREVLPRTVPVFFGDDASVELVSPRRRAMGLEFLLRREFGVIDGWVGYTLLSSREQRGQNQWRPAQFDQRHNLVLLLSAALPRGFRLGFRFRLVSGNPLATVLGGEAITTRTGWFYAPIRAPLGHSYQPLFHQLDVRLDKRWPLRRIAVTAYLDVQNIYDRRYPEVYIYTADWSERASLLGLPIYPSLGIQLDY